MLEGSLGIPQRFLWRTVQSALRVHLGVGRVVVGVMIELESGVQLSVKKTKFQQCVVSDTAELSGLGGGLFLSAKDGADTWLFENLDFVDCTAWKGKNFFPDVKNLKVVADSAHLAIDLSGKSKADAMGFERDSTGTLFHIPLELYFRTFGGTGHVAGAEEGMLPCHSFCFFHLRLFQQRSTHNNKFSQFYP